MTSMLAAIRAWSNRHRRAILLVATLLFLAGIAWSVVQLDLGTRAIDYRLLAPICLITPVAIVLNANELQLCARVAGGRLSLRDAVGVSTAASVANLLPLPAGLLIRGGALMQAGASLKQASSVLLAAGLMWIAMAFSATALSLAAQHAGWLLLGLVGVVGTVLVALWIGRRSSALVSAGFVAVRGALLAVLMVRLWLAFAAIGAAVPLLEAVYYSAASVAGTVVMIVPAGLGVSEGLAAAMAAAVGSSAAAAFLALGINRVIGLVVSGLVAGALWSRTSKHAEGQCA